MVFQILSRCVVVAVTMEQSPFYSPIPKYIICMHENIIVPLLRVYGALDVLVVILFAAATAEGHDDLSMIDESLIVRSRSSTYYIPR